MKRVIGIDIVKVVAAFFVISVHFFLNTRYYNQPLTPGENLFTQTSLRWLFLNCVPLFLISTGFLQMNKTVSSKYYKGILPILGVYLFYSVITIIVRDVHFDEHNSFLGWGYQILSFGAVPYAWYVNMFIGLYLIIPFLNAIFHSLADKQKRLILILILIILTGLPLFFNYLPVKIMFFPGWWMGLYPLAYYFIGCYIREYRPKINKWIALVLLVLVTLSETIITYLLAAGGPFKSDLGDYGSIIVMASSVLLFLLLYDLDFKNSTLRTVVSKISTITLDIYLASYLADRFVYQYVWDKIFESNYQIIYYFVPIVGSIIAISVTVGLVRKWCTDFVLGIINGNVRKRNTEGVDIQ
ncbi:hypothetical protein BBD41_03120 [Paenibacillus ihbetae]|uniref:Acyltransferase 3 domain-containing protein n=1 Tax=Paenibacillus ihbetae TaxID=1870820 RepID=A0A1B2DV99_9BACL|nr:acyltransferase family protein [Paenibacillus ihbetae]ANY71652.1 hypothetical protein BBD41_03120 [Paenibacillus ihbetae]